MFGRILVPFDGSPLSDAALRLAISIAQVEKSSLVIAHAADARMIYGSLAGVAAPSDPGPVLDALRAEGEATLARARAVATAAGIPPETHMMYSSPVSLVLSLAEACRADLIVMGTHGRRGFARALLGSTTEGVLRGSAIPVLAVRVPFAPATTTWPVGNVFAAVDESDPAEAAAAMAIELVKRTRGTLELCDVVQTNDLYGKAADYGYDPTPIADDLRASANRTLDRFSALAEAAGVTPERLLPEGTPSHEIVQAASGAGAGLIVIGSHGRRGLHRLLIGSVAEAVVRDSLIPVLVVRQSPGAAEDEAVPSAPERLQAVS